MAKTLKEIYLYDWATEDFRRNQRGLWERYDRDRQWEVLIYVNRFIDAKIDPGILMKNDHGHVLLGQLYERGYLTGRAYADAAAIFPNLVPKRRDFNRRLQMYKPL